MKWEDYHPKPVLMEARTQVDVECPVCGKKLWKRTDITLTSIPPQYRYECECGWVGFNY